MADLLQFRNQFSPKDKQISVRLTLTDIGEEDADRISTKFGNEIRLSLVNFASNSSIGKFWYGNNIRGVCDTDQSYKITRPDKVYQIREEYCEYNNCSVEASSHRW